MSVFTVIHPDTAELRWVTLQRKGKELVCIASGSRSLPPDTFTMLPLGPQIHKAPDFMEAVKDVLKQSGAKRHILVLPDAWMKSFVLSVEALPRRTRELRDLVGWHLKKAFLVKPEDVRFAWNSLGNSPSGLPQRLFVTFAFERLISAFEEVYAAERTRLGLILSSFWAVFYGVAHQGAWALLVQEGDQWTFGIFQGDRLETFRQRRLLPDPLDAVAEELERTLALSETVPERLVVYQNPAATALSIPSSGMVLLAAAGREEIKAGKAGLPPFWHPEGEIFCGGLHALP